MILGGIGICAGDLVVKFIPQFNIITTSLTGPIGFNLEILSFSMKLNFASIVGIIFGIIVFRKI